MATGDILPLHLLSYVQKSKKYIIFSHFFHLLFAF